MKTVARKLYANAVIVRTLPRKALGLTFHGLLTYHTTISFQSSVYYVQYILSF